MTFLVLQFLDSKEVPWYKNGFQDFGRVFPTGNQPVFGWGGATYMLLFELFLGFVFIVFMVNGVVLMQSFCLLGQIKGGFLFYLVYQLDPVQILSLLAWPNVDGCYSNTPIELTCLQVGSPWEKLSQNPETHFCIKKPHLNPEMVEPKLSIIYEDFWASSGT